MLIDKHPFFCYPDVTFISRRRYLFDIFLSYPLPTFALSDKTKISYLLL